jgi:RNA polymerase sigma-70 factor (ECF subfamily)
MNQANDLLQHLRANGLALRAETASDGQLLDRFLTDRDEAAFEALLARLGPMVWAVCRRQLTDPADVEDAFQATFLVLVRKGRSVVPRDRVGSWLYGVACHAARKARVDRARRRDKEHRAAAMTHAAVSDSRDATDLAAWIDQELGRLPEKYRAAVVLCDLEGKTRQEAARHLGWPEGTVAGRLARAREMLARRLAKHGLAVTPAAIAAALANQGTAGMPPSAVLAGTRACAMRLAAGQLAGASPGAQLLVESIVKTMLVQKLRGVALGLGLLVAAGLTVGGLADRFAQAQPAGTPPRPADPPAVAAEQQPPRPADDLARLVGTWKLAGGSVTDNGTVRDFTPAERNGYQVTIDRDGVLTFAKGGLAGHLCFALTLDATTAPRQLSLSPIGPDEDRRLHGVYQIDATGLRIACFGHFDEGRPPRAVEALAAGTGRYLVLERVEAPPAEAKAARPPLPPDRAKVIREQFAGTWQVTAGDRDGTQLSAWERRAFLFGIGPDATFTAHRGALAGRREFTADVDLAATPRELILTPVGGGKSVRVRYEFQDAALLLDWDEGKAGRHRFTLMRHGTDTRNMQPTLGLTVDPAPERSAAAHLEGRWQLDRPLTQRLSGRDIGSDGKAVQVGLTIANDPAVAGQVPAAYRELLDGKRILMAGRITYQETTGRTTRTRTHPFVLTEHAGTPVVIYFDGPDDRPWSREEVLAVQLVPARGRSEDLLFLTPFDPGADGSVTVFRRSVGRR